MLGSVCYVLQLAELELRGQFLICCQEANNLQSSLDEATANFKSASSDLNARSVEDDRLKIDQHDARARLHKAHAVVEKLTEASDQLQSERLLLRKYLFPVLPISLSPRSIVTYVQTQDTHHPITECPICYLGYFCNNWIPTPCGHTYHPICLFSLIFADVESAPKCVACLQVFHPAWLECWGAPQVNHPTVVDMAEKWGLTEQAESFSSSLRILYQNKGGTLKARRDRQSVKLKKVTKSFSKVRNCRDAVAACQFSEIMHELSMISVGCVLILKCSALSHMHSLLVKLLCREK